LERVERSGTVAGRFRAARINVPASGGDPAAEWDGYGFLCAFGGDAVKYALAALLFWAILTIWVTERWAWGVFQLGIFALAAWRCGVNGVRQLQRLWRCWLWRRRGHGCN
jgi:hypothetical protein